MEQFCEVTVVGKSFRQFFGMMKKLDKDCIGYCTLTLHDLTFSLHSQQSTLMGTYQIKFCSVSTMFNLCRGSANEFVTTWQFDVNKLIETFSLFLAKSDIRIVFCRNEVNTMYVMAQSPSNDIIFGSIYIETCSYNAPTFAYKRFTSTVDDPNVKVIKDTMRILKKHLDEISCPELRIYDQGASLHVFQSTELPKFVIGNIDFEDSEAIGDIAAKTIPVNRILKIILQTLPTFPETSLFKIYHQIGLPLLISFDTCNGNIKFHIGL